MNTPQPPWGPSGPDPRDWRAAPPPAVGPAWDQLFELDDVRRPLPGQRDGGRGPKLAWGTIVVVVVIVLAAVVGWLATRDGDETALEPVSSVPPSVAQAQSKLLSLLPAGYPQGNCATMQNTDDQVAAAMSCKQNTDAGGPTSATFALVKDKAALDPGLNRLIGASTTVECPGRIQSPGPWRRNATPQLVSGTLFCGYMGTTPVLAWTDDAKLLLSEVRGQPTGPALTDLYTWWSSHS